MLTVAPTACPSERGGILTLPHIRMLEYFPNSSYFFQSREREACFLFYFEVMLVLFKKKQVFYFVLNLY